MSAGPAERARAASPAPARPTLEDVAARAGVGRGTASRALNSSPGVRAATSERVLVAARELGYRPNLAARSLVTRRTGAVALVMGESQDRLFADPFFADVVRAVSRTLLARGRQLVLLSQDPQDSAGSALTYLTGRHTDGVLLASSHQESDLGSRLDRSDVPVVRIGRHLGDASLPWVDVDNVGAGVWATEHLLARGVRAPATLTGPLDMHPARSRREGYRQAVRSAGLEEAREVSGEFTWASGHALTRQVLTRWPGTDGIFAQSDQMAAGALQALTEAGRAVPEQVRVVGFDDSSTAPATHPSLTTVHQPIAELGARAATMLLDLLDHGPDTPTEVLLPVRLVVRESS